jgi:PAP2 superfamily
MQYAASIRELASRRHPGVVELAAIAALYAVYELARGLGDATLDVARANTARIVDLERSFGLFFEASVQDWAAGVPSLSTLLGLAYVTLHLGATGAAMVWLHRSHPARFAIVRNVLVIATALSLVFDVLYPAAPPRLSGLGFADTVSSHTHVNLSSDLLGSLYNPFAAVPSMHFGYALLVGIVVATTARRPLVRAVGALYPPFMLFDIVATGNHFLFDAAMGALVVAAAWILANGLARDRTQPVRLAAHAYA